MAKEIERKFLCQGYLPGHTNTIFIDQYRDLTGYLFVSEGVEARIRKKFGGKDDSPRYRLAVKIGNGLSRDEYEEEITAIAYEQLMYAIIYPVIVNDTVEHRFLCDNGDELKIFVAHTDNRFFRAEIEFPSEEAANKFQVPPEWGWKEVTDDPQYAMKNYWVKTRIKGEIFNGE